MIIDLRLYTVRAGRLADYVALYREYAWPLQQQYLGRCLGWYTSQDGPHNQVVHLWAYENAGDREARRDAMARDPAWQAFLRRVADADLLVATENRILKPTDFSPPPGGSTMDS